MTDKVIQFGKVEPKEQPVKSCSLGDLDEMLKEAGVKSEDLVSMHLIFMTKDGYSHCHVGDWDVLNLVGALEMAKKEIMDDAFSDE